MKAIKGNIIFTILPQKFEVFENSYLLIENGKVKSIERHLNEESFDYEIIDYKDNLIIPSFVDLHLHAVQYANIGIGMDLPLLPWLEKYTYPEEQKFGNLEYAKKVFKFLIRDLYDFGTLRSCIFSSLHKDATILLMKMMDDRGLSAYIGKTNMDRNSNENLFENTRDSLKWTIDILDEIPKFSSRIRPIITPRFIPSCSDELLIKLGQIAEDRDIAVQSHLNENLSEIEWVRKLVPESKNYLDAYDIRGLVRRLNTIMAHAIYNTDDELELMKKESVFIAHCPSSNMNLTSGIMKAKKMLEMGINIGLGSDISAGDSLKMNDIIVDAIKASKLLSLFTHDESDTLSIEEAFYMSTRGGGKFFGNCGSFEYGSFFDALVIDDSSYNLKPDASITERLEMFIYRGDDRNIIDRYLEGRSLKTE